MDIKKQTEVVWQNIWSSSKTGNQFDYWINRESESIRFKKIANYIKSQFNTFSGLKTMEIGAGMGVYSFLFAKLDADATLLDVNKNAIDKAKAVFCKNKLKASFINEDIFNLKKRDYSNKFDVVMSFGFVEHFKRPERFDIVKIHYDLLRPGGVLAIGVPNIMFLPHEIMKHILRIRGKWLLGYEQAFSRRELGKIACGVRLKNWKIIGSSFIYDFRKYLDLYRRSTIGTRLFGKHTIESPDELLFERESRFDDFLGADIVLLGLK